MIINIISNNPQSFFRNYKPSNYLEYYTNKNYCYYYPLLQKHPSTYTSSP